MTNIIDNAGALEGITILDLTRVLSGPYSTMLLGDMGASIIKIEEPLRGDDSRQLIPFINGESIYFITNNRNKKAITLNLKSIKGKEIFKELVRKADVITENYRPGIMEKLGIGYNVLNEINPAIIYASISGFGHYGRYKDRPGYDIIAQAMSGLMSTTGWPSTGPTRTGTAIGDVLGGLFMTIGVLGALQHRNRTGRGQKVDVALVDSAISAMGNMIMIYLAEGRIPARLGNRYEPAYPYDSFECADGSCVIGVVNDKLWKALCLVMGRQDLAEDTKYARVRDRQERHDEVKREIETWTKSKASIEVVNIVLNAGIPAAPIYEAPQVVSDQHFSHDREMFIEQEHPVVGKVTVTGNPIKYSDSPVAYKLVAPKLGQNNLEVYKSFLGLDEQQLAALKTDGVI